MPDYCPPQQLAPPSEQWKNGLLSCDDKFGHCLKAMICPGCVMAQTRTDMDGSSCFYNLCCMGTASAVAERVHMRYQYRIEGSICNDILISWFCQFCNLAQMSREVELRGRIQNAAGITASTPWSTGLCEFDTPCILGVFCPLVSAILLCAARTKLDDSPCMFNFCCDHPASSYTQIRNSYMITGGCCGDVINTRILMPCAAAQLYREVEKRGLVINKSAPCQPVAQAMK